MEHIKNNQSEAASLNKIHSLIENATDYVQKMHCDTTKWTRPFKCAVPSCPNAFIKYDPQSKLPFKFHNFPLNVDIKKVWIEKCKMKNESDMQSMKICSNHFKLDDYERNYKEEFKNPDYKRKLKEYAIPTKNLSGDAVLMTFNSNDAPDEVDESVAEDLPPFDVIKAAVDRNIKLKERIEKLQAEKSELCHKFRGYSRKLRARERDVITVRNRHEKLKKNNFTISEQKNLLSKVFSDAQINVLLGKKKVVWSNDDLAMAFTLRQMGSRECYLYLKQMLNMPLPALSCVQKWAASK